MPKKDFLLLHLNKNKQIQTLRYEGQRSLEKLAGALFQTIAVTGKKRHKAQGARPKVAVGGWRGASLEVGGKNPDVRGRKSEIRGWQRQSSWL